jgi:superoxide dismutase, Cu-Zn family
MIRSLYVVGFAALLTTAPLVGAAAQTGAGAKAHATIKDAHGKSIGNATLTQTAHGVLIAAELSGLPAGQHGMHIHAVGKCEPPAFTTAGGHFNPTGRKHGYNAESGPHMGDLPNLIVANDGKAFVDVYVADLSLGEASVASGTSVPEKPAAAGAPRNLFEQGGAALVIHAKADDYATDPAGNSGDRIACGVVER